MDFNTLVSGPAIDIEMCIWRDWLYVISSILNRQEFTSIACANPSREVHQRHRPPPVPPKPCAPPWHQDHECILYTQGEQHVLHLQGQAIFTLTTSFTEPRHMSSLGEADCEVGPVVDASEYRRVSTVNICIKPDGSWFFTAMANAHIELLNDAERIKDCFLLTSDCI